MIKFDKIVIIDVESTCWKYLDPRQISEIIEIGICIIDTKTRKLSPEDSIIIKPKIPLSDFCTELTSLTQEDVDKGITFSEACKILENRYKHHVWASYGNYDKRQFRMQCERENVKYPFSDDHINIKMLFALYYSLPRMVGMKEALDILDLELEGRHHRGNDDARNIARIFYEIFFKHSFYR